MKNVELIVRDQIELNLLNCQELRRILKTEHDESGSISRVNKSELVSMIIVAQENTVAAIKVNKSALLRKEVRRRAQGNETLNSGELIQFMADTHNITMSRQFVVNVRNRFLKAWPELLKA